MQFSLCVKNFLFVNCLCVYKHLHVKLPVYTVSARIIERKLRSTKVRLFTVPCCSIILFSSEGMKKKRI